MGLGIGELILVGCLGVLTAILAVFDLRVWRWFAVALCAAVVAAVVTPADPASTIVISGALIVFYLGGAQLGRRRLVAEK